MVKECADRESNPGRELGKLESYHWTIGALRHCVPRAPQIAVPAELLTIGARMTVLAGYTST